MELSEYIRLARKWLWLLSLAAVLAGGVAFLLRSRQEAVYQADVMLSVGGYIEAPNPNTTEIYTGERLAQTYAVLAKTYDVLEAVIAADDFPLTPQDLEEIITARILPDTSLLVLSVSYVDPVMAADIANELAQQLILNSPSNLTAEQQAQVDLAQAEITKLTVELTQLRAEVALIDDSLSNTTLPTEVEDLRAQRAILTDQINQSSANLAQFTETLTSLQQRTNSLDIVEAARIPDQQVGVNVLTATLLGAILGIVLAAGVVLLIEYLDDTIKTPEQVSALLNLPVLGAIVKFSRAEKDQARRLITFDDPTSPVSESYRQLRTNLFFSSEERETKVYVVTSPGPEDGKSVTAANLAVVMAATGMRVLLVDADMRRPVQHQVFGVDNEVGLTTLLSADPRENLDTHRLLQGSGGYSACLHDTEVPNLRLITSGFLPANPSEILGAVAMRRWANSFKNASNVDVVIFDTPPLLVVSDSTVLAAATDAEIILVLRGGKTRSSAAIKARNQIDQLSLNVNGVVLNQVSTRDLDSDYGYGYGYYYYNADKPAKKSTNGSASQQANTQ